MRNYLKIVTPPWPTWHEAGIWRLGYMLPWATTLPNWWLWCWMIPPFVRDMRYVPLLGYYWKCGEWP